jgi:hypothetical protein
MFEKRKAGSSTGTNDSSLTPLEAMLGRRALPMLGLCYFALSAAKRKEFPCREYLQKLNAEATSMEELVDHYGAQKNESWFTFREAIAAQKLFTAVTYDMIHLQDSVHHYTLLGTCSELALENRRTMKKLKRAIIRIGRNLTLQARQLGIAEGPVPTDFKRCDEVDFNEQLPANRKIRHVEKIGETVVYMATQFLNLSEDRHVEELLKPRENSDYLSIVPNVINEECCRLVEVDFHNLQSLYDTYIFESDMESQNRNLSYLRGHISIIYHLLKNGTDLIHYYIRHMSKLSRVTSEKVEFPLEPEEILGIVFNYLFPFAREYMESAVQLCRSMIKSYSIEKAITVPIPNYRGFHVRPSTLIAKIVAHYGGNVKMILDGNEYDAGMPLDLFRANEAINADKRRYIGDLLSKKPELQKAVPADQTERNNVIRQIFLEMTNNGEIMVYDLTLAFDEVSPLEDETLAQYVSRCIKHFQSLAKVDVNSRLQVTFQGDNRTLNDLRLLAENGYGEDRMGNNIMLPEKLAYLRR